MMLVGFVVSESEAAPYKLMADDAGIFDHFGWAVATNGNTALVGAYLYSQIIVDDGTVYVFKRNDSYWQSSGKLIPLDPGRNSRLFGYAVDIDDKTAVIGAPLADSGGSVYIFQYNGIVWYQKARLVADDANGDVAFFGCSVAIDGNTVIIGAQYDNQGAENSGAAYVFKRDGSTWTQEAKLKPSDADADQWFGYSVAIDANTAVVGAHAVGWNTTSGWAYIYQRNNSTWTEKARLMESDSSDSVAIFDRTVVVGNKRNWNVGVYTYEDISVQGDWSLLHTTHISATPGDSFGSSVALDVNTLVIGAEHAEGTDFLTGRVTVYRRQNLSWIKDKQLAADDGQGNDQFGCSVALSNGTIVVGAQGADGGSEYSGAAYVFNGYLPQEQPSALYVSDRYGYMIRVDLNTLAMEKLPQPMNVGIVQGIAYDPFREVIYGITSYDGPAKLVIIDRDSGAGQVVGTIGGSFRDIACHPLTGRIYACLDQLIEIDPNNATATIIGTIRRTDNNAKVTLSGLGFDEQGNLYGSGNTKIGQGVKELYRINPSNASATYLASTSPAMFVGDITFDWYSGQAYGVQSYLPGPVSQLLTIDLNSGITSIAAHLTDIGANNVSGLAFVPWR
jgi:hypothetical protein